MRALVLSAGSERGAFQAGALQYLLGEKKIHYPLICGVSVGAINGAIIAQYRKGQEQEAANQLSNLWNNITLKDIYKSWKFAGRAAAIWKLGFFDGTPLTDLIHSNISSHKILNSGKKIIVGATSLNSGKYILFDQDYPYFLEAINASAAFPIILPPVKIGNNYFIDGGIKEYSPIKAAIDAEADEIDIIIANPKIRINKFISQPSIIDVIVRAFDIAIDKIMVNDLERLKIYNHMVEAKLTDKKYIKYRIIQPENNLTENLMKFDHQEILEMITAGYESCKEIIG